MAEERVEEVGRGRETVSEGRGKLVPVLSVEVSVVSVALDATKIVSRAKLEICREQKLRRDVSVDVGGRQIARRGTRIVHRYQDVVLHVGRRTDQNLRRVRSGVRDMIEDHLAGIQV